MNMAEAVAEMTKSVGITKTTLSQELGFSRPSGVLGPISKARLYGDGMKLNSVIKWAHQCGYDLVLQPAGCLVDGQIVLGNEAKPRNLVKMEYELAKAMKANAAAQEGGTQK